MRTDLLSFEDQVAFLIMRIYEQERQKRQVGYVCFRILNSSIVTSGVFGQFRTVGRWIVELGFDIKWIEVHWIGYIEFVFREFKDQVPQPGQLKNNILIRRYISIGTTTEDQICRTDEELTKLYHKILRPEIVEDDQILRGLGLKDVSYARSDSR